MHNHPEDMSLEQLRQSIQAIEGTWPPEFDYSIRYDGGKIAEFVQIGPDQGPKRYIVLFPWWGGATVTGVVDM